MNWGKPWRHRRGLQVWVGFMRLLAAALLMTMALLSAARGEERIALVVANPAYDGAPSIANAELSAELVATSLRSLGFSVQQVSDGDRADVAHAMYDFAKSLASADSVGIFYYVGHTAQANGRNYMLTRGARTDSKETVDQTALPLDLFLQALEATPTFKLVFLDNPGDGDNPTPGVMQGLAAIDPPSNAIVTFSAKPGSVALNEAKPVTVFADALTAALTRRDMTIGAMLASVTETVANKTLAAQGPWVAYGLAADGQFVLTPDRSVAAAPTETPPAPLDALPAPEPEPVPPMQSWSSGSGGSDISGSDGSGPADSDSGFLNFDGRNQESHPPMDVAPGSGNPDAWTGNSADEAAQYEEYKRQEQQRQQARQQYEAQKKYQEDAGKAAAAAQNDLGGAYREDGEAGSMEPTPPPEAQSSAEPPPPPPESATAEEPPASDTATSEDPSALPPAPSPAPAPPPVIVPLSPLPDLPSAAEAPSAPLPEAPPGMVSPPVDNNAVEVVRHPSIDAPDEVVAGETVTVSIALTEEQLTPEVKVKAAPGSSATPDGALAMAMPAGTDSWPIDIDLFASGFDLVDGGKWSRQTTLYREGDSDFVRFDLKARPIAGIASRHNSSPASTAPAVFLAPPRGR